MLNDEAIHNLRNEVVAITMIVDSLPQSRYIMSAFHSRTDGTTAQGVFDHINEYRLELRARLAQVNDQLEVHTQRAADASVPHVHSNEVHA